MSAPAASGSRECPACKTKWPLATRTCPADGTSLVSDDPTVKGGGALDDDDRPIEPGTLVGEYKIEKLLGAGGMGEVYTAHHPVIGKRVAIKVMNRYCSANPINVERFVQEAKAVNAIGHPNIVDIFSFGHTPDGRCYFVMELLEGEPLTERIVDGPAPLDLTYAVIDAVLRALEAAHVRQIIHRDLKPDNIFLVAPRNGEPERIKLLDFGIAKLSGDGMTPKSKTQTGSVVGTPAYMSPEQAAGGVVEGPSDVYSLGVVVFELVTGRLPFVGESTVQLMAAHVCEPAPAPSTFVEALPDKLERLIVAMLQKKPAARPTPAQIREIVDELGGKPATTVPISGPIPRVKIATPATGAPTLLATLSPRDAVPAISIATDDVLLEVDAKRASAKTTPGKPLVVPKVQLVAPAATGVRVVEKSRKPLAIAGGIAVIAVIAITVATRGSSKAPAAEPVAPLTGDRREPVSPPPPPPAIAMTDVVVQPELDPEPASSGIELAVTPADAIVEIAGKPVAIEAGRVRTTLAPGKYALTISRAGYARDASTFEVVEGQTRRWSIALRRSKSTSRAVTPPSGSAVPTGSATPVVPPAPPTPKGDGDGVRDPFAK